MSVERLVKILSGALSVLVIVFLFMLTCYGIAWCVSGISGLLF